MILSQIQREALETLLDNTMPFEDPELQAAVETTRAMLLDTSPPVYIFERTDMRPSGHTVCLVTGVTPILPDADGYCLRVVEVSQAVAMPGLDSNDDRATERYQALLLNAHELVRRRLLAAHGFAQVVPEVRS